MEGKTEKFQMDFKAFVSGLLAEGLVALGVMKHPSLEGVEKNLRHADMVIDTLAMIQEKTSGNLTKEESEDLENILHQLRIGYVAAVEAETNKKDETQGEQKSE